MRSPALRERKRLRLQESVNIDLKAGYYPAFFIAYGDGDELLGEHYRKIVGNFEIRHYKNKNY